MRTVALSLLLIAGPAAAAREGPSHEAYHIVGPRNPVGPGEHVELKLVPTPPATVRATWHLVSNPSEHAFYGATYRAPYVVAPGAPQVEIGAGLSGPGWRTAATILISLTPGAVPGADDCLGPGQSFSPTAGDIVPSHAPVDEFPALIQRVDPDYPPSAFARGIEDTITVIVLVCRSGRVLDAYVPPGFLSLHPEVPVERDPKLVQAAIAAARQFVFRPARVAGEPVATWVGVSVPFRK